MRSVARTVGAVASVSARRLAKTSFGARPSPESGLTSSAVGGCGGRRCFGRRHQHSPPRGNNIDADHDADGLFRRNDAAQEPKQQGACEIGERIHDRRNAFHPRLSPNGQNLGDAVNHQNREHQNQQAADDERRTQEQEVAGQHGERARQISADLATPRRPESPIGFRHAQNDQRKPEDRSDQRPAAMGADRAKAPSAINRAPATRILNIPEDRGMGRHPLALDAQLRTWREGPPVDHEASDRPAPSALLLFRIGVPQLRVARSCAALRR